MRFSVIIPTFNAQSTLNELLNSLSNQTYNNFEIIVVDDCSTDSTAHIAKNYSCRLIRLKENRGPAYCRNIGARKASGDLLVFTDSDCKADPSWLENVSRHFSKNDVVALMGRLELLPSNFLGDSISALGFPAGGGIGFDKMWKVDEGGFAESLSSCNFAVRKDIFWGLGGFDETFPYPGGEDSLLAYHLRRSNYKIKYCPDVVSYHEARDSFNDFLKWQFRRGVSSFIFSKKVSNKKDYISLRIWSTKNIVRHYCSDRKFPLILFLLGSSVLIQLFGYLFGKTHQGFYARTNH